MPSSTCSTRNVWAMTEQRVRIDVHDHVAVVTLSRPDKHNALDAAMFDGILAAAEEVAATPGVRAVVLHGEGPSFCSGLDVGSLMSPDSNVSLDRSEERRVGKECRSRWSPYH